jgi:hypothetical protein
MAKLGPRQRGYDHRHDLQRARWAPKVNAGLADCARCQKPIQAGQPWDLGHTDDRTAWTGPEHASCNRRAGALVANALRTTGVRTSRKW